jgi:hypothetical protein
MLTKRWGSGCVPLPSPSGLPPRAGDVVMRHEHKSREVIWGGQIMGARYAEAARDAAKKALREANRAEAEAWSLQMEGYGGPAQPSPTIGQCINGNGWLEVECSLQEPREHTARCDLAST